MDDVNERLVFVDLFVGDLDRERDDVERGDQRSARWRWTRTVQQRSPTRRRKLIADRLSLAVARTGVSDQDVAIRGHRAVRACRSAPSHRGTKTTDRGHLRSHRGACGVSAGWLAFGEGCPCKPLPTGEEVTKAVTVEGDAIRVVDLRATFGTSIARRMTGGPRWWRVTAAEIRAACDLDANTGTLGVAAQRVGASTRWGFERQASRSHPHARRAEGSAWNRIPKGVVDKIAAMRGAK